MAIIKEYFDVTTKYINEQGEKTLVLFQVGSFFEVYGLFDQKEKSYSKSNIYDFSIICDMVISEKKINKIDNKNIVMAGFGLSQIDKYIKKLNDEGYTIVVYIQKPKNGSFIRELSEIISPGTYFKDDVNCLSNITCCVWIEMIHKSKYIIDDTIIFGVSTIDTITGQTTFTQFSTNYIYNPSTYEELERQISIYNPKECILISTLSTNEIHTIIEYTGLSKKKTIIIHPNENGKYSEESKRCEKQIYQKEVFQRFFPDTSLEVLEETFKTTVYALNSFIFLVDFMYQHNPYLVQYINYPKMRYTENVMTLANHSLRQLNIIDDMSDDGKNKSLSVFLNNCMTQMGKRRFINRLHYPYVDKSELIKQYNFTEYLLSNDYWDFFREKLRNMCDIEKFIRELVFRKAKPNSFIRVLQDIKKTKDILKNFKDKEMNHWLIENNIQDIKEDIKVLDSLFSDSIDTTISITEMSVEKMSTLPIESIRFFKKGVFSELDALYDKSLSSTKSLIDIQNELSKLIGIKEKKEGQYVKIHEMPKTPPLLTTTKRRSLILVEQLKKHKKISILINDSPVTIDFSDINVSTYGTNKKDVCILCDTIERLTIDIFQSKEDYSNKLIEYYNEFIDKVLRNKDKIENMIRMISLIDNEQNKCFIAKKYNYCKPTIEDSEHSYFDFTGIRHPLIEFIQKNETYVTNDLSMNERHKGMLLYGTNAVGKTSFLKSIGISIIMAQCGLYVPCETFKFKPYTKIFTRILGNDNIFKGLSTFAVEMSELRTILMNSDSNSLVIGDELCSGTESDSARSIFIAGIERLYKNKATFMFATHFHEINDYPEVKNIEYLSMKHMEVVYDNKENKLVYNRKLKDGPGNNMYGLEVCKALHLPDDFLDRAHEIRRNYNSKDTSILSKNRTIYSKDKIKGLCEICKIKQGEDVHHLKYQKEKNENNYIDGHHMNHPANLINICNECHNKIHKNNDKYIIKKTSNGYELVKE